MSTLHGPEASEQACQQVQPFFAAAGAAILTLRTKKSKAIVWMRGGAGVQVITVDLGHGATQHNQKLLR